MPLILRRGGRPDDPEPPPEHGGVLGRRGHLLRVPDAGGKERSPARHSDPGWLDGGAVARPRLRDVPVSAPLMSPPRILHSLWIWGPLFAYLALIFYLSS